MNNKENVFEVKNLEKVYTIKGKFFDKHKTINAVNKINFSVKKGETYAIVGESGCGKSTLAKLILNIEKPTNGQILYHDENICDFKSKELKEYRKKVQIIFQDPYSSLNPRWNVEKIIAEPLLLNSNLKKSEIRKKVFEIMEKVSLKKEWANKYPHQFSGGQRQRISIARALIVNPEIIVCDEPVSALDVSVQAQVLNLLLDLQEEYNLTYIFISHDLSVVKHISDRVMVMNFGNIEEIESVDEIFTNPKADYTKRLLHAIPKIKIKEK